MEPLVTVCVTTYNRESLLPITIDSIINQSYKNLEIIIVDDCSSDGTKNIVEQSILPKDKRIIYIRSNINEGLAKSRNKAIHQAKGRFFTFCDDDDILMSNFVEIFVQYALKYDENWCFACGFRILQGDRDISYRYIENEGYLKNAISEGFAPPVASQFYNTSILKRCGGYNTDIKSGVDHDLWITLSLNQCMVKFIPEVLSKPNNNQKIKRMTNSFRHRTVNIEKSLELWKTKLIQGYGEIFFKRFIREYRYYLFKTILLYHLNSRDYFRVFKLLFLKGLLHFPRIIKEYSLRNDGANEIIMSPLFKMNK